MRAWTGASFPLAILLALAALTLWLKHAADLPNERAVDKLRHDPDTIIEQFTASTLDSNGKPLHQIWADRLVHYADDNSSDLTNPRLRYTPAAQSTITINAKRGKMLDGKEEVRLYDDVRVERAGHRLDPGWLATMPDITAFPPKGTAHTKSAFIFTQGLATIQGTGFSLDRNAQTATLDAAVRAHFPPRNPLAK